MSFRLSIEDGRFVQSLLVETGRLSVGRSEESDLCLRSKGVSRLHAVLRQREDTLEIEDRGSKNGLVVNGHELRRTILRTGDTVQLGRATIRVEEIVRQAGDPPPPAPAVLTPPPGSAAATGTVEIPGVPVRSVNPRTRGQRKDFDELVYAGLRQTPWYTTSAVLHAIFLVILSLFDLTPAAPEPLHIYATVALHEGDAEGLDDIISPLEQHDPLEDLERLEPDEWKDDATVVREPKLAADEDEQDIPIPEPNGAVIGGSETLGETPVGLLPSSRVGARLGTAFGKDDADRANQSAASALRSDPFSRSILRGLKLRMARDNIRIISGEYDQCEKVLHNLGLEYDVLFPEELEFEVPKRDVRAIFYNCTPRPLSKQALANLDTFVRNGGHLFTTDWGVEYVIERLYPQYVTSLRRRNRVVMTADETISFTAVTDHPLLRGVPAEGSHSRWWLEKSSILLQINSPKVEVLIRSDDLESRYGSDLVAVTFRHGRGRVVHVLGHFFQQEGNLRGTYAMQRLLMNFLYEAVRTR